MSELLEDVIVVNPLGIHARPAAMLAQGIAHFQSDVYLLFNGNRVNAKSIMGLLTLGAARGSRISVSCIGEDAEEAMLRVKAIFESGFNEMKAP